MDIYNSKFPLLFALGNAKTWAVTIGQTTWYSVPKDQVSDEWRKHEDEHKRQWREEGRLKFAVKYLWYQARLGYKDNPYEIEARQKEIINVKD
jgi:hypothetical protein